VIISHLLGGLGNQMFQYAAGRALAVSRAEDFYVDLRDFNHYELHNGYELGRVFKLNEKNINQISLSKKLNWQTTGLLGRIFRQPLASLFRSKSIAIEPHFNYWPNIKKIPSPVYMRGYWQTEKYFQDCKSVIREDFSFKNELIDLNKELSLDIKASKSVAIHVRRGDYVLDRKTAKVLVVQDINYYKSAIRYMASRVDCPNYFIFSDDIEWVKENFKFLPNITVVSHNQCANSHFDMQLMSLCQHNIIANSSFSWWGAWLNDNPSKIVIAPQKWFINGANDSDLIPSGWIKL
jgi:hypothetical protein